jgi:hypothetical protein
MMNETCYRCQAEITDVLDIKEEVFTSFGHFPICIQCSDLMDEKAS